MNKAVIAALSFALTTGSAMAADLPSYKAPPTPPPPPPLWTGFYVGLNAGGTWSSNNSIWIGSSPIWVTGDNPGPNLSSPADYSLTAALGASGVISSRNAAGFIGGGQIGYNWQFGFGGNSFVYGIEADIQGITNGGGHNGSWTTIPVTGGNILNHSIVTAVSARKNLDYLGTVRGRIGYLFTPTLLVYGTGGLAYGGVNLNVSGFQSVVPTVAAWPTIGFGGVSYSDARVGWTAGGGLEWMFMPNWSAKIEYLYYNLGSLQMATGSTAQLYDGSFGGSPAGLKWLNATQARANYNGNIVRAGVNYHFNWGAPPVVAKY
ncbi:outer membrane beta-barrel protein [Methylocystis sp. B8]|uniref:outer membrane protein n=1 Tax=Methylocystis sp. B8 TaxID=544938 RepID=UPI0010FF4E47|nr:outer membrane beta-barrel protein [Methylocystis sp. B8]TLG77783.1 porin family protein [Methylocystis sp. B8]